MNYKKDLAVHCEENLSSLSEDYISAIVDVNFKHIIKLLNSSSSILHSQELNNSLTLSSLYMKVLMLSEIIPKSAEEFESLDILKVWFEGSTDIFQDGKSIYIETLNDGTLKISAVNE